jgi:hypothetical protein
MKPDVVKCLNHLPKLGFGSVLGDEGGRDGAMIQVVGLGADATFCFSHNLLAEDLASFSGTLHVFVATGTWRVKW